jgi:predicted RNase H-like nuclease
MRILGADLRALETPSGEASIVVLDAEGAAAGIARAADLPALAREAARLASGDPFLLAVDVPVSGPSSAGRPRRVDGWLQRRLGVKLPHAKPRAGATPSGADVLAALATAGQPCLPYPDRDRRRSGLAEIHPELVLKALAWEASVASSSPELPDRDAILRALGPSEYRGARVERGSVAERWAAVEAALRLVTSADGFDARPARDELARATDGAAIARAASLLDAALLAGAARRYLEEPERSAFVGERETGYTILPADVFLRRVVLKEAPHGAERAPLFPRASLDERLGGHAAVRPLALLDMPGRAQRVEAVFEAPPLYEFDNLDEMMWWKHCRHLSGPDVPLDGLDELVVKLDGAAAPESHGLRLVRSRHKTLSFRFEPAHAWRQHLAPRDGKTYPFRVLRAVFEAAGGRYS